MKENKDEDKEKGIEEKMANLKPKEIEEDNDNRDEDEKYGNNYQEKDKEDNYLDKRRSSSTSVGIPVKKKELKKNLVLLLVTIIVIFIFLEMVLAIFVPQKLYNECYEEDPKNSSTWENELDQYIGWVTRKNFSKCFYQPDTNEIVYKTHNSKGVRLNKEIPYEKDDKKRIIILGDSFAYGFGLNDSETIAIKLQENLGEEYEVIPMASSGYSTVQETLFLKEGLGYEPETLKYNPDIVILFFYVNDFENNFEEMHAYGDQPILDPVINVEESYAQIVIKNLPTKMEWMEGYGPKKIPLSEEKPLSSFLLRYSHLYSLWFHKKDKLKFNYKKSTYLKGRISDGTDVYTEKEFSLGTAYKVFLVTRIFDEIESIAREKNFKFIVVNIPAKIQINKGYQKKFLNQWSDVDKSYFYFNHIDNIFNKNLPTENEESKYSIEYISLSDLAEENFDDFYFKTDPHWGPAGVKLSADYITKVLKERKII